MDIGGKNGHATKSPEKNRPYNPLFSKRAQDIEFLRHVPESSHQTGSFGVSQHIGTLILSQNAFPRIVVCHFLILLLLADKSI